MKYIFFLILVFLISFFISYQFDIGGRYVLVINETTTTSTVTTTVKPKVRIETVEVKVTTTEATTTTRITTTTSTTTVLKTTTTVSKAGRGRVKETTTTIPKPVAKIIINEVMYDPPGSDPGGEWIEIYNNDTFDCDIVDWKFFEDNTNHRLNLEQGSMIIPAKGYAIIADNATNFIVNHPGFSGTVIDSVFSLSNIGEYIALKDYSLSVVDEVTYNSSWGGNGTNKTLERKGNEWYESLLEGGTPGYENSVSTFVTTTTTLATTTTTAPTTTVPVIADHVVISEIYYDPFNESCSEFIELYNPKSEDVNISAWTIATPTSANDATIPPNSFIKSYGFYLIVDSCWYTGRDESTWPEADHNETITLRNDDGWIILKNNLGTIVDKVGWGNATNYEGNQTLDVNEGKSIERKPGYLNSTAGNGWDSDNNLEDFISREIPEPQNSSFVEFPG